MNSTYSYGAFACRSLVLLEQRPSQSTTGHNLNKQIQYKTKQLNETKGTAINTAATTTNQLAVLI